MDIIYQAIFYTIINCLGLLIFKNNSNISDFVIVPIITALLIKYFVGECDKGFLYSIYYWSAIFGISFFIVILYNKFFNYKLLI